MTTLLLAAVLILGGGVAAVLLRHRPGLADRVFGVLLVAGCALGLAPAVAVLAGGPAAAVTLPGSLPGGPWVFGLDGLSAWFLLAVLGVGACAGVFGLGYLSPERGRRSVAGAHTLYALLVVALAGVVTAQAMVPFLAAWEVMAVSAYLLVMFEHGRADVRRAGLIYILLTHLSTLALIGMFAAFSVGAADRTFAGLGVAMQTPGTPRTFGLIFALVGFGLKAGVVPLHFWLPGAHAAAPSHVSAVLSGVMLKMGIYGLLRVLSLMGPPPAWFGWTLAVLGLASGVLGVLWALGQQDLKRLLAYHSVENIGIILLGMGVGVLGLAYGHPAVAVLGFTGALLHSLNHALFKSLLFLGAGAVLRATGTRVIDELGGLARQLPWTALTFGVGSVAIVGLPPFNGFVSEWVVFQGLLTAGGSREALRFAVVGAAGLALIGGLALACFTKLNGVVFLGQRRSTSVHPGAVSDPSPNMLVPMVLLAGCCAGIGLLPSLVLGPAQVIALDVSHAPEPGGVIHPAWVSAAGQISALGFGLVALTGMVLLLRRAPGQRPQFAATWSCGSMTLTPRAQYTASSYAAPLLIAFGPLAGVRQKSTRAAFHSHAVDPVQDVAVVPAWQVLKRMSARLRDFQGGRLRWYLLSVIFTLLALLYYLTIARHAP
jgi:formate hydrogenlyase subunit 3/multisubunit Na+/H+ antiporter MnhD subunit